MKQFRLPYAVNKFYDNTAKSQDIEDIGRVGKHYGADEKRRIDTTGIITGVKNTNDIILRELGIQYRLSDTRIMSIIH